jgi:hypothetical protein
MVGTQRSDDYNLPYGVPPNEVPEALREAYPGLDDDAFPTRPSDARVDRLLFDLRAARNGLPAIGDETVGTIICSHVLQYLSGPERIEAWNEWYRVLQPAGRVQVVVPYYSHVRAFAHPLTQFPPLSELSFMFLSREFREANPAHPVPGLECDFEVESYQPDADRGQLERFGLNPSLSSAYDTRTTAWLDNAKLFSNNVIAELTVWLKKL